MGPILSFQLLGLKGTVRTPSLNIDFRSSHSSPHVCMWFVPLGAASLPPESSLPHGPVHRWLPTGDLNSQQPTNGHYYPTTDRNPDKPVQNMDPASQRRSSKRRPLGLTLRREPRPVDLRGIHGLTLDAQDQVPLTDVLSQILRFRLEKFQRLLSAEPL